MFVDGFLSQFLRDLIAVLGLLLALVGTFISAWKLFSNRRKVIKRTSAPQSTEDSLPGALWTFLTSPADQDAASANEVKSWLRIMLGTLAINILVSAALVYRPSWNSKPLIVLAIIVTVVELYSLTFAIYGATNYLKRTPLISERQLKQWNYFWFWCWLISLLSSTLAMATIKNGPSSSWIWSFVLLQALGVVISNLVIVGRVVLELMD